jgi:hypothetical protein
MRTRLICRGGRATVAWGGSAASRDSGGSSDLPQEPTGGDCGLETSQESPASTPTGLSARPTRIASCRWPLRRRFPQPMLARSGPISRCGDWAFEVKWDGYRAIVSTEGAPLRVRSRRGWKMTDLVPELLDPGSRHSNK